MKHGIYRIKNILNTAAGVPARPRYVEYVKISKITTKK